MLLTAVNSCHSFRCSCVYTPNQGVCVCVCVCMCMSERERVCVCVHLCKTRMYFSNTTPGIFSFMGFYPYTIVEMGVPQAATADNHNRLVFLAPEN